jgi:carbamoylphosphate synthase large subunit
LCNALLHDEQPYIIEANPRASYTMPFAERLLTPCCVCWLVVLCVQDEQPYIIEANPRASRTVPFVAKAVGHPIAKYASLLMAGKTLKDIGFTEVCCITCYFGMS